MKVRSDFVSNSSSCSFVLKSPFEACKQLQSECRDSLSQSIWSDVDNIEIYLHGDKQHLEDLKKLLGFESESIYSDFNGQFEVCILSTTFFSALLDMYDDGHKDIADAFSKMTSVSFSVDDYNRAGVRLLSLLYKYFKQNCNADVSKDGTEHDFDDAEQYDFVGQLQHLVSSNRGKHE